MALIIRIHLGKMSGLINVCTYTRSDHMHLAIMPISRIRGLPLSLKGTVSEGLFQTHGPTTWHINAKLSDDLKRIGTIYFSLFSSSNIAKIYITGYYSLLLFDLAKKVIFYLL